MMKILMKMDELKDIIYPQTSQKLVDAVEGIQQYEGQNPYQDILDEILRLLIENGKALEINTAGLKAGLSWPNPHMEILKRYRSLGGELITIGSDAHRPEHMAFAFDRLPEILSEAGFSYYTLYREQKPYFISLES